MNSITLCIFWQRCEMQLSTHCAVSWNNCTRISFNITNFMFWRWFDHVVIIWLLTILAHLASNLSALSNIRCFWFKVSSFANAIRRLIICFCFVYFLFTTKNLEVMCIKFTVAILVQFLLITFECFHLSFCISLKN